ncbi:hypothetical protein ACWKW6_33920 [Dyadobacter jiangsuensis]
MDTVFTHIGFGPRERHAIVGSDHYEDIIQLAYFFQRTDNACQVTVKPLNFIQIIH